MAKSEKQKLKLLYIMKILMEQTDEEHPMPMSVLLEKLAREDIKAERKSIYSDAYDVGEYACRKLGQDFERCLHMRNDNYRLSYIFGDERSR